MRLLRCELYLGARHRWDTAMEKYLKFLKENKQSIPASLLSLHKAPLENLSIQSVITEPATHTVKLDLKHIQLEFLGVSDSQNLEHAVDGGWIVFEIVSVQAGRATIHILLDECELSLTCEGVRAYDPFAQEWFIAPEQPALNHKSGRKRRRNGSR